MDITLKIIQNLEDLTIPITNNIQGKKQRLSRMIFATKTNRK